MNRIYISFGVYFIAGSGYTHQMRSCFQYRLWCHIHIRNHVKFQCKYHRFDTGLKDRDILTKQKNDICK